ncbi:hypothetical protein HYQ46_012888 [Verticillium longisporum]|nr:hypothetical protein HYQ44_003986 [Verticillium longisporum]KAG7151338.1 hypothetical protein HYQ46_012888 [Verticillium longisporum]
MGSSTGEHERLGSSLGQTSKRRELAWQDHHLRTGPWPIAASPGSIWLAERGGGRDETGRCANGGRYSQSKQQMAPKQRFSKDINDASQKSISTTSNPSRQQPKGHNST